MLSSKLLSKAMEEEGRRYWFNRFLDRLGNFYQSILKWVLAHRKTTVFGVILLIVGSLALIPRIGAVFILASDQGQVQIKVDMVQGTSLTHTEKVVYVVS